MSPPPSVEGLEKWQAPENPIERRVKGRAVAMGGGIVAGFGALLLGSGALMFWGPTNCNLSKDWFCDLPQRLSGLGFLSAGGVQVGIGTIVMAIGAYRARGGGHEANVGHVLGAGKPQWTRLRREDGHLDSIATTDSLLRD